MTRQPTEQTEKKIAELEKWIKDNKGHPNAYLVANNIKILQLTLKNATENEPTPND